MAAPAHAGTWYPESRSQRVFTTGSAGVGAFQAEGDWITANDVRGDSKKVVTRGETSYGRDGECKATGGAISPAEQCNYNLDEDHVVRIKVCLRNYSNDIGWENCSNWTPWLSIATGGVSRA